MERTLAHGVCYFLGLFGFCMLFIGAIIAPDQKVLADTPNCTKQCEKVCSGSTPALCDQCMEDCVLQNPNWDCYGYGCNFGSNCETYKCTGPIGEIPLSRCVCSKLLPFTCFCVPAGQ